MWWLTDLRKIHRWAGAVTTLVFVVVAVSQVFFGVIFQAETSPFPLNVTPHQGRMDTFLRIGLGAFAVSACAYLSTGIALFVLWVAQIIRSDSGARR